LCLGWRQFSAEIAATAGTLTREKTFPAYLLFVRSVRKLLARFNPVLWEDEPKGAKIFPLVSSLEEDLEELGFLASGAENADANHQAETSKLTEGIIKNAFKLESEGPGETIPIGQLRRVAWWSRLAPIGREKLIIIESSDRMQDESRNSLLKLLEEPPGHSRYVLCTDRQGALSETVLSRLRVYRFVSRDAAAENEVIRRVFHDEPVAHNDGATGLIGAYLDSFLPVSAGTLEALAAFFAASVAYKAALLSKKQGCPLSDEVLILGKSSVPKAEAAGLGRPKEDAGAVVAVILEKAGKFELRPLFSRFLSCLLEQASASGQMTPEFFEMWKKCSDWAQTASGIYNLRPVQVLEKLFIDLSRGMASLSKGSAL